MQVAITNVTPTQAAKWLENNKSNRPVKNWAVNKYAKDLLAGNWATNHQGIAFDNSGNLVDGQHRLLAIIKSGVSVDMVVAYGAERFGVDRLAPRSMLDDIKYSDLSNWIASNHLSVANAMIELMSTGTASAKAERTSYETVEFCNKYRDEIEFVANAFKGKHWKFISAAIVQGTIAVAAKYESHQRLAEFIDILATGLPNCQGDFMAVKARDFLTSGGAKGGGSDRKKASKTLMRAIYLFCRRQSVHRLQATNEFTYQIEVK
jgi:hypothetical protein